ncbi:hypothetical protein HAV21_03550 [Paenarthrobacter sp. MSM-2-10-13]|uniref:hypothetical protein n=1 Tax=Paenarthrobacter sp. MSM-2-10-13 TaxID=2717318 RepID=UPI001421EA9C|nr:hypothetical protein [Paenarthrobacter sp. MSM-2-10-13]NHW45973.1 hypothetical protein [Paenarthrobacter sp. MSM-2-10-13]
MSQINGFPRLAIELFYAEIEPLPVLKVEDVLLYVFWERPEFDAMLEVILERFAVPG